MEHRIIFATENAGKIKVVDEKNYVKGTPDSRKDERGADDSRRTQHSGTLNETGWHCS